MFVGVPPTETRPVYLKLPANFHVYTFAFVDPFDGSLLAVHIHGLALAGLVADVAEGAGDSSGEFYLVLHGWMKALRVERRRSEHLP